MDKIATEKALAILKQALNDKIAQLNYVVIQIEDVTHPTEAEQLEIGGTVDNGTVYNVIIKSGDDSYRIIGLDWGYQNVLVPNIPDSQNSPYIGIPFLLPSEME